MGPKLSKPMVGTIMNGWLNIRMAWRQLTLSKRALGRLVSRALTVLMAMSMAAHTAAAAIEIVDPWARPSPPGAPSAGFMLVKNTTLQDDVLIRASGDFANKIELHLSSMVDGVMKMAEQKQGIVVPAGGEVLFKPGGYHLMFMGLYQPFSAGEQYQVTLEFKQAGKINVLLPVKSMDEAAKSHMHH